MPVLVIRNVPNEVSKMLALATTEHATLLGMDDEDGKLRAFLKATLKDSAVRTDITRKLIMSFDPRDANGDAETDASPDIFDVCFGQGPNTPTGVSVSVEGLRASSPLIGKGENGLYILLMEIAAHLREVLHHHYPKTVLHAEVTCLTVGTELHWHSDHVQYRTRTNVLYELTQDDRGKLSFDQVCATLRDRSGGSVLFIRKENGPYLAHHKHPEFAQL